MLVSSLIIFPAVSALFVARNFKSAILLATLFSVLSVIVGIFASYVWNLPSGATIVGEFCHLCERLLTARQGMNEAQPSRYGTSQFGTMASCA